MSIIFRIRDKGGINLLKLKRGVGESIFMGESDEAQIIVDSIDFNKGTVTLGFIAPGIKIRRAELEKFESIDMGASFRPSDRYGKVQVDSAISIPKPLNGVITKLDDKGFGFLYSAGIDGEIFFHATDVDSEFSDLEVEDEIEFSLRKGERGLKAVEVKVKTLTPP